MSEALPYKVIDPGLPNTVAVLYNTTEIVLSVNNMSILVVCSVSLDRALLKL